MCQMYFYKAVEKSIAFSDKSQICGVSIRSYIYNNELILTKEISVLLSTNL